MSNFFEKSDLSRSDAENIISDTLQKCDDGELYLSPSLVSGSYTIRLQINEYLFSNPVVDITTSSGGKITNGPRQMLMYADNPVSYTHLTLPTSHLV